MLAVIASGSASLEYYMLGIPNVIKQVIKKKKFKYPTNCTKTSAPSHIPDLLKNFSIDDNIYMGRESMHIYDLEKGKS